MNNKHKAVKLTHPKSIKEENQKLLNFVEAAKYLSLSQSHLYKLTSTKRITHYKPGGKIIYFMKSELDDWVYSKQITSSKPNTNKGN